MITFYDGKLHIIKNVVEAEMKEHIVIKKYPNGFYDTACGLHSKRPMFQNAKNILQPCNTCFHALHTSNRNDGPGKE